LFWWWQLAKKTKTSKREAKFPFLSLSRIRVLCLLSFVSDFSSVRVMVCGIKWCLKGHKEEQMTNLLEKMWESFQGNKTVWKRELNRLTLNCLKQEKLKKIVF
jgi:hypothetical protein